MSTLWLVGCGTMAGAMLSRWLDAGMDPARVTVITPTATRNDVRVLRVLPDESPPTMLMLGVKPQMLGDVAPGLQAASKDALLLSILAGTTIATLKNLFPAARGVARIMPNLPVAIGKGVVALHTDAAVDDHNAVTNLMAPLGLVEWIANESHFDAVTALSGSGPAFVYRFIDAWRRVALRLACQQIKQRDWRWQQSKGQGCLRRPAMFRRLSLRSVSRAKAGQRVTVSTYLTLMRRSLPWLWPP